MRRLILAASLLLVVPVPGLAQEVAKVEVFGGYAYLRADSAEGRVNLHGWTLSVEGNLNRALAVVADFDGTYGDTESDEDISSHSFLFGPKFTARRGRWAPFAHVLFGWVRDAEAGQANWGFGMTMGGGVDYDINRRISIRVAQADYEFSHVDESNHHNFRFAAGVVVKFGKR
jgi:opacity protein-like surface antigen